MVDDDDDLVEPDPGQMVLHVMPDGCGLHAGTCRSSPGSSFNNHSRLTRGGHLWLIRNFFFYLLWVWIFTFLYLGTPSPPLKKSDAFLVSSHKSRVAEPSPEAESIRFC